MKSLISIFVLVTGAIALEIVADHSKTPALSTGTPELNTVYFSSLPSKAVTSSSKAPPSISKAVTSPSKVLSSSLVTSSLASSHHTAKNSTHIVPASTRVLPHLSSSTRHANASSHHVVNSTHIVPATTHVPHLSSSVHHTTPKPPQKELNFTVKGKNGSDCLYFKGQVSLQVHYVHNKTKHEMKTDVIELYKEGGEATGKCLDKADKNATGMIAITWKNYSIAISFTRNNTIWYMSGIKVELNATANNIAVDPEQKTLKASQLYTSKSFGGLYQAGVNNSYTCSSNTPLPLSNKAELHLYNISVTFKDIGFQPYSRPDGKSFKDPMMCPSKNDGDSSSSIVPIAVGCALAGLIVIVLIAYLIGRRRGNRGYQQV